MFEPVSWSSVLDAKITKKASHKAKKSKLTTAKLMATQTIENPKV